MNALSRFRPRKDRPHVKLRLAALAAVILLSACRHAGDITSDNGGGVYAVRSDCPIAGVPAATGDVTLFNPPGSTDSRAIDVTAAITDVRATCQNAADDVVSTATFTVVGLRRDAGPARQVVLPYFDVALRGGSEVAAKQVGQVVLNFAAGDMHAWARVQATIRVNRAAATLPARVREILTRERKPGETEAAIDPMSDPTVQRAVANATFEHLVGFELTQDQLKYNATR
jgi:alkylated DNA nucleotide flippase Atl1